MKSVKDATTQEQIIVVPPSTTATQVKVTIPLPFHVEQSGGTPPENIPPTVNAGQDQEITLPTRSTTLRGIGFDRDGDVVSYRWQQVIGAPGIIIDSPFTAQTIIDGLTEGTFVFRLTVTDNNGATAYDDVVVSVLAEPVPNVPPSVNAGQDLTITLPQNSVLLDGTASDPDGSIVSSLWSKVSGGACVIQNPTAIDTMVTGLVEGTYTFKLDATDNAGATRSDTMNVTVLKSQPVPTPSRPEGFGALAIGGGNSSTVYHVTNLNSSGSGSLIAGIGSNKTIVFDVSGTIRCRLDLVNISYLTIDATGRDITIDNNNNGNGIAFENTGTHHCILRNINVTNAGMDGINVVDGAHDILIDHCSSYGNRDGNIDFAGARYCTMQYCILGNGGDNGSSDKWAGDTLVTSAFISIHHCLFVPKTANGIGERCPLIHCSYSSPSTPNCDFRNNLVWGWGRNGGTGSGYGLCTGYGANTNAVNNYFYTKNASAIPANACVRSAYGEPKGNLYAAGNVSGNSGVNPNSQSNHAEWPIPSEYQITLQDTCDAARTVLDNVGARPLNSINQAFVDQVTQLYNCASVAADTDWETQELIDDGVHSIFH